MVKGLPYYSPKAGIINASTVFLKYFEKIDT
jgi:hypothetical protein